MRPPAIGHFVIAPRRIGYYVHHHGAGHRTRAAAIASFAGGRVTLIGTGLAGRVGELDHLDLADDRIEPRFMGADRASSRPDALHFAPLDHDGIRRRVAAVTQWIAENAPALMVIDVSVEMAMLARLASVPTVVVRLGGRRTDPAHLDAFRGATALLCPFAAQLDDPDTPAEIVAKSVYFPGLIDRPAQSTALSGVITVLIGGGGIDIADTVWAAAARSVPDMAWHILGPVAAPPDAPHNLTCHGWVDDAPERIARSEVVIATAGNGSVGTVLAARRPLICIPQDRPFAEQRYIADGLARAGAAIVCEEPAAANWRRLIDRARALDPAAAGLLDDPHGPNRAANWLTGLADHGGRC